MNHFDEKQQTADRSPQQGMDRSSDPLRWTPIFKPTEPGSGMPEESLRTPSSRLALWIVFFLLLTALLVGVTQYRRVALFLGAMGHVGPNHPADERFAGFVAFSLILVLILAVVRILQDRKGQ